MGGIWGGGGGGIWADPPTPLEIPLGSIRVRLTEGVGGGLRSPPGAQAYNNRKQNRGGRGVQHQGMQPPPPTTLGGSPTTLTQHTHNTHTTNTHTQSAQQHISLPIAETHASTSTCQHKLERGMLRLCSFYKR